MARCKNTSDPEEVARLIRGRLESLGDCYKAADLETLCAMYEPLLVEILEKATQRPTVTLLCRAARGAFGVEAEEARFWAVRVAAAVSHARHRMRTATTGKRIPAAIRRVGGAALASTASPSPSVTSPPVKRTLQRYASDCSSVSGCRRLRKKTTVVLDSPAHNTRAAILNLYGVRAENETADPLPLTLEVEGEVTLVEPALPTAQQEYLDLSRKALVRSTAEALVTATMTPGPGGFAVATFQGETPKETELPNLCLEGTPTGSARSKAAPLTKRPSMVIMKTPAAARTEQGRKTGPSHHTPRAKGADREEEVEEEDEEAEETEEEEGEVEKEGKEEQGQARASRVKVIEVLKRPSAAPPAGPSTNPHETQTGPASEQVKHRYGKEYYKRDGAFGIRQLTPPRRPRRGQPHLPEGPRRPGQQHRPLGQRRERRGQLRGG